MRMTYNPVGTDPCVLVLGMFDGVHLGHQALFCRAEEMADAWGIPVTVCTFEPHPLAVLRPKFRPKRLTTPLERAQQMALCGVDWLCVHDFTRSVADLEPEEFLDRIRDIYNPAALVCGYNYTFGRRGAGDGELIQRYAEAHDIWAAVIPAVEIDGEPVSSTRVRKVLQQGDVEEAARLMGHAYTLSGPVVHGKHMGHVLGFPTANVAWPKDKVIPGFGVYACRLTAEGQTMRAVVNVGCHPTLPEGGVTVEAYALEECPDLYGKRARVTFLKRLRAEQTFPDAEALKAQIRRDRLQAEIYFDETDR